MAEAVGAPRLKWVAVWTNQARVHGNVDGARLAGKLGVGVLVVEPYRSGGDLQFYVSGDRLWSASAGYRSGGEKWGSH